MNPFSGLADIFLDAAGKVWITIMLVIWGAGLWLLRLLLSVLDAFTTPDLSPGGPLQSIYPVTLWLGGALATVMLAVQIGVVLIRRDGASLARALLGLVQYLVVVATFTGIAVAVVEGCSGLSRALMSTLLRVDTWVAWTPFPGDYTFEDLTDAGAATVLGILGPFLGLAAIGHVFVMLARAGALIVLVVTTPIAAAGLLAEAGRAWFWKALRWFLAAAFAGPLMVLMLGIGTQIATAAAATITGELPKQIGTVVVSVILICISIVAPLALFRLLAFVDPGTSNGAALRAGLAATGGLQGMLSGRSSAGGSPASSSDATGTSQGESDAGATTDSRFATALGPLGAGIGLVTRIGTAGASIGADLTSQMGVGDTSYFPDMTAPRGAPGRTPPAVRDHDPDGSAPTAPPPTPPMPPPPSGTPPTGSPAGGGMAGGGGAGGLAEGAEVAAL